MRVIASIIAALALLAIPATASAKRHHRLSVHKTKATILTFASDHYGPVTAHRCHANRRMVRCKVKTEFGVKLRAKASRHSGYVRLLSRTLPAAITPPPPAPRYCPPVDGHDPIPEDADGTCPRWVNYGPPLDGCDPYPAGHPPVGCPKDFADKRN